MQLEIFSLNLYIYFLISSIFRSSENFYTSLVDIQTSEHIYDDVYSEGSQSSYSGSNISQAICVGKVSDTNIKESSREENSSAAHVQQRTTSELSVSGDDTNSSSKTVLGSDPEYGLLTVPLFVALAASRFINAARNKTCLLYTSPSPRDGLLSRMPSSA